MAEGEECEEVRDSSVLLSDPLCAWNDRAENGACYTRNAIFGGQPDEEMPQSFRDAPFGQGCTMYNLGKQPGLVQRLRRGLAGSSEGVTPQQVADVMANALRTNFPRSGRVQLGIRDKPNAAAMETDPETRNMVLTIWASDSVVSSRVKEDVARKTELHRQRGGAYTPLDFRKGGGLPKCDAASRAYRTGVAVEVVDALRPLGLVHAAEEPIEEMHVVSQVKMEVGNGRDQVQYLIDYNMGDRAIVFSSPEKGCMVFTSNATMQLPASSGRNFGEDTEASMESMLETLAAKGATTKATVGTAVQHKHRTNHFSNVDTLESTYLVRDKTQRWSHTEAASKTSSYEVRAIATALAAAQQGENGSISGRIKCDTIRDILRYTPESQEKLVFENTAGWRNQLTDAAEDGAVWKYMREDTSMMSEDNKTVTHYAVDRKELAHMR